MCRRNVLTIVAVAIFAMAIGQAQAITVDVPNGDFQTIHHPDDPTNTAYIQDGEYFNIPTQLMHADALATYDVGDPGSGIELPGWVQSGEKANSDVMQGGDWGGPDGAGDMAFLCFAGWGGDTLITSAAPLSIPVIGAGYTLSADVMMAKFDGALPEEEIYGPVILELLADGVKVEPDDESTPVSINDRSWVEYTRTYNTIPEGDVTILVGTRKGDGDWGSHRASVDNVELTVDGVAHNERI